MDKQYKTLMEHQNIPAEVTAQIYEKMEQPATKSTPIRWKAVLAAACIVLMIPLTVLAVETIFATPTVKLGKLDWHDSPNGYSVRFENLNNFPLDAFPEEVQTLEKHKFVPCDSWEEAEETLGIDLLNNPVLSKARKVTVKYNKTSVEEQMDAHTRILYSQYNGQLSLVATSAHYLCDGLPLDLRAKLTVEHPEQDTETQQILHGTEGVVAKPSNTEISYEEYTTKEGIPTVILRFDRKRVIQYAAFFSVNDISYEVTAWGVSQEREETNKQILLDVLDGFKLK